MPRGGEIASPLRQAGAGLFGALRQSWDTALLLAAIAAATLAAVLPIASLLTPAGARLGLAATAAATVPHTPAATQQAALVLFFKLLAGATLGTLCLALITLLMLAAARASRRGIEHTIRRAVGAARRTLLLAALLEGGVIATASLMPGLFLGGLAGRIALRGWPGLAGPASPLPAALVVAAVIGTVLFGALFTLVFAVPRRSVERSATTVPLALPVFQLAVAFALLVGSGLLARHVVTQGDRATTAESAGEVYRIALPGVPPGARATRYASWLDQLAGHPELGLVSLTSAGGHVGLGTGGVVTTDCGECSEGGLPLPWQQEFTVHQSVSADSFKALGLRVVEGRGISTADRWGAQPVAVVSRQLAMQHFQSGQAVGRDLQIAGDRGQWFHVVGMVEDPTPIAFGGGLQPPYTVYLSVLQQPAAAVELLVRPPAGGVITASMSRTVAEVLGPGAGELASISEAAMLQAEQAPLAWFAAWLQFEGWALLMIALAGTIILLRLWVQSVQLELGIRRAVGASRGAIVRYLLLRAGAVGLGGVGLGFWFGPALWNALPTIAPGAPAQGGPAVIPLALFLVAVSLFAVLGPAWRASRMPPNRLLQSAGD